MNQAQKFICWLLATISLLPSMLHAQWSEQPITICSDPNVQVSPQIASDGSGGAFIVWEDYRNGIAQIFAQRVDAAGHIMWGSNGISICSAGGTQERPQIATTDPGGAIVVWQDRRGNNQRIYAQKIIFDGTLAWSGDGVLVSTAPLNSYEPQICEDGSGGAIITWYAYTDYQSILAQRLDAGGNTLWTSYGRKISCNTPWHQQFPRIISDGSGGAIIGWIGAQPYALRIDGNSHSAWSAVSCWVRLGDNALLPLPPQIAPDGSGGAFAIWRTSENNGSIRMQRIDNSGLLKWGTNGQLIASEIGSYGTPQVFLSGSNCAVITYYQNEASFAQKIDQSGNRIWAPNDIQLFSVYFPTQIITDGAGGVIIVGGGMQCLDPNGLTKWSCPTCAPYQSAARAIPDGSGGAITVWQQGGDIAAQHIDGSGSYPVATMLQHFDVSLLGAGIEIKWALNNIDKKIAFSIKRSGEYNGSYIELPSSELSRDGLSFSYVDKSWDAGNRYYYRIEYRVNAEWQLLFEAGPIATPLLPLTLYQNHPNPFNPSTTIEYYIPEKCFTSLRVYDVFGKCIATLVEEEKDRGQHSATWDGKNNQGHFVASGIYLYQMAAGKEIISKKMVLLK